jgi:hypothetical protein
MEMDGAVIRKAFIALATLLMGQATCGPLAAQPRSESGIAGVAVFGRPPPDFNPLTASNAQLDEYGFPPRPDRNLGPEAQKRWEQRVMSQTRIVPELAQTNVFHGPVKGIKPVKTGGGTIDATSANWSGYAITDPTNPFVKPGSQVEAQYVVPKPRRVAATAAPRVTARPIGSGSTARYRTTYSRSAPNPILIAVPALPTTRGSSGFPIRKSRSAISRSRPVI